MEVPQSTYYSALEDFNRLQRRAAMERLWNGLTGKSNELLSYDDVSRQLKIKGRSSSGIQNVPLDAIVGSVGRYNDFTRNFLPKHGGNQVRWARVRASAASSTRAAVSRPTRAAPHSSTSERAPWARSAPATTSRSCW